MPEGVGKILQEFSFEGAGKHIDPGKTLDEVGENLEDFTFEKAGENIDQIVRDIRNIAQRNIAHL